MRIITLVENTAGDSCCGSEHGLSFYVETKKHRLLVDSGATDLFLRNAKVLGVDLSQVDTMILSHGHYDHGGGILAFCRINSQAGIYMQRLAVEGYYRVEENVEKYIGLDQGIKDMTRAVFVEGDRKLDEELYLFSGIQKKTPIAKGNLKLKKKEGDSYVQDEFDHEQCLVITEGEKHVLMSGCAHNGILNILERYYEIFQAYPDVVISGFHIRKDGEFDPQEKREIQGIAEALLKTNAMFYTGHCTDQNAFTIMKEIMGEKLLPLHSGLEISASAKN